MNKNIRRSKINRRERDMDRGSSKGNSRGKYSHLGNRKKKDNHYRINLKIISKIKIKIQEEK